MTKYKRLSRSEERKQTVYKVVAFLLVGMGYTTIIYFGL
jgi:hypothetical protein